MLAIAIAVIKTINLISLYTSRPAVLLARSHRIHPGETWLDENLEAYRGEAILEASNQEPLLLACGSRRE